MASGRDGEIDFYYYEPRGIIPLDERFLVRKSLAKKISEHRHAITFDTAFEEVIRSCARLGELPDEEIWISEEIVKLYSELFDKGIAHSVEVWDNKDLVGGLYGLSLGGAFCGESMFSKQPFASQIALVALVERLRSKQYVLLDAQMESEHLKQFGLFTISQDEYLALLDNALTIECKF